MLGSTAVTSAPNRARDSDSSPPPHPTSRARRPCRGRVGGGWDVDLPPAVCNVWTMYETRVGFIPMSVLRSASHHVEARASKWATSSSDTEEVDGASCRDGSMLLLREAVRVMSAARLRAAADEKGLLWLIQEDVQLRFATRKQALVLIVNWVPISDHALTREAAAPLGPVLALLLILVRVAAGPRGRRRM